MSKITVSVVVDFNVDIAGALIPASHQQIRNKIVNKLAGCMGDLTHVFADLGTTCAFVKSLAPVAVRVVGLPLVPEQQIQPDPVNPYTVRQQAVATIVTMADVAHVSSAQLAAYFDVHPDRLNNGGMAELAGMLLDEELSMQMIADGINDISIATTV